MLLFRSEEHVDRWCRSRRMERGAILTLEQVWGLARAYYGPDRRDAAWRRKTADESAAVFAELGLTSPFWSLRPPAEEILQS
jgi:hypothetical protein